MEYETLRSNKGTIIEGILLIKPKIYKDERGLFLESWNLQKFNSILNKEINFVQDNHSQSIKGVLRGLHFQRNPYGQGKLIRCINGEIFDLAVDLRQKSKTFCQWVGVRLNSFEHHQLWIPNGFAHGFLTISDYADVAYKTDQYWMPKYELSLRWDDPKISINWPNLDLEPFLSKKDKNGLFLDKIDKSKLF